jgi:Tfp pilus assembly protein PilE
MTIRNHQGFTIIDLLVVLVILAVLVFTVTPAIRGAINQTQATTMKEKGRRIWMAVIDANIERLELQQSSVWPGDVVSKKLCDTPAYFTFLLSDGETTNRVTAFEEKRQALTLIPEWLLAPGLQPYTGTNALSASNIAWRVTEITQSAPQDIAFLLSRNVSSDTNRKDAGKGSGDKDPRQDEKIRQGTDDKDASRITLNAEVAPFGDERAVWISKGGRALDARRKQLYNRVVMGIGTNTVTIWKCE